MTAVAIQTIDIVRPTHQPNGKFAPGNRASPGRPRGIDIRAVCEQHAAANGIDLRLAIWEIMSMQLALAKAGDPAAVKVVLSTLGDAVNTDEIAESLADVIAATIEKNRTRLAAS